ncbi:MAG: Asp-tRNA(Asn)/Glu-tRNA(Gln) amidotransferase subunit GatA [Planctomycetes bacterium]|nr:Asp-tRNA(Asn)/Glu-tRNA(Gln) amidotransferase subunit GatA [Planctomycetota bacterium]
MVETVNAVRGGACSAREVVTACLARIEAIDQKLHAFLSVDGERALTEADRVDGALKRGDALGPLAGVPIAVKDNLCTTFGCTTCGSRMLESFQSQYNAHAVDRLQQAGAIIVGKTNLDEFAMGSSTENSAFFATTNPWDGSRVAGGSSGGSAAAVAARLVPGALGSDTGGSTRQPASFCGVVGLKPSYGRVSRYGLVAFSSSLDQVGPITRDVRDTALLLKVIAGHDPRDSTCVDLEVPDYLKGLEKTSRPIRVGVCSRDFGDGLHPEVESAVNRAIETLASNGAEIVPVDLPHVKYGLACYYLVATAECSSNLARFDGVHYGRRTPTPTNIADLYERSRGEALGPETQRRIMLGTFALSTGYYDAYYLKALKVRTLIRNDFDRAFDKVDVIASPVTPTTAFRLGDKTDDPLAMYLSDVYTITANLTGHCAVSVPCGVDSNGLPIGLQFVGPAFQEQRLLSIAHQYQSATSHHTAAPPCASAN